MSDIPRYGEPGFNLPPGAPPLVKRPQEEGPLPPLPGEIPRYGDPGFNLPQPAQPTYRLRSFDPEIFREALRQSPNPSEEAAKIAASIQMASRLNMDPSVVLNNFDVTAEKYLGAKAVPMGVFQALGASWEGGYWTAERNKLGAELMRRVRGGGDAADVLSKIDAHEAKKPPMDLTPRSLPLSALKWALESTAGFYEPMAWSAIAGLVAGPGVAGGLAALGIPEGTVAAARIASLGRFAAGYASTYESMAGGEMLELWNLKDKDGNRIQPRAAVAGAAVYGLLGGLSEYSEIANLLPGGNTMLGTIIKKVAGRLFGKGNKIAELTMRTGLAAVGGYLGNVTKEAGEELVQRSLQTGIEEFLKEAANQAGASFVMKPLEERVREAAQAFGQAWAASTIMVAPRAVAEIGAAPSQARRAAKIEVAQERLDNLAAMMDDTRPPEERAAAIDKRVQELTSAQKELAPKVAGLEEATVFSEDLDKAIDEFRTNNHELAALRLFKNEEEANDPNAPWRKTPEEQRAALTPMTDALGLPTVNLATGEPIMRPATQLDLQQDVLSPESQFRQLVKELTPAMPERQVDALGLVVSALAYVEDVPVDTWLGTYFAPEIARMAEPGQIPEGKRGAFVLGSKLILITANSNFSTWLHEIGHGVFTAMSEERLAPVAKWAGAMKEDGSVVWDDQAHENLTAGWVRYLQEGFAPTPELKGIFERMTQWLLKAWEVIAPEWQINDDIRQWMATLLTKPESGVGQAAVQREGTTTEVQPQAPRPSGERAPLGELELFQPEPPADVFEQAVQVFGVTEDIREGGYILPDGRMLDFSGRHLQEGRGRQTSRWAALARERGREPQAGQRMVPHGEILGTLHEFVRAGAIRMDGQAGIVMLGRRPTAAQELVIREITEANKGAVSVELALAPTANDSFFSEASPEKVLGAIRRYYRTGELPAGRVLYQTDPATTPELAKDIEAVRTLITSTEERIRKLQAGDLAGDTVADMYSRSGALPQFIDRLARTITALQRMTDRGVMLKRPEVPERFNIIHKSTKPEDGIGNWRISAFDEDGPAGHRVGGLDELLEEQISGGWEVVETKGRPILPTEEQNRRVVLRPDILYQPDEVVQAIKESEWFSRFRDVYKDKVSGMDVPMPEDGLPLGVWMVDDTLKMETGRMVSQLREVNVVDLKPGEETGAERMPYVNVYTKWAEENKIPPPLFVLETDQGTLMITNGHRRWLAAKAAGKTTIRAWVNPREDSGIKDSNGNPIWRPMTDKALAEKHGIRLRVQSMEAATEQPWEPVYHPRTGQGELFQRQNLLFQPQQPLPPVPPIAPPAGVDVIAAVRTDDGSIYTHPQKPAALHIEIIRYNKIPPERVTGGGFYHVEGDYYDDAGARSDAGRIGEQARARARAARRRGGAILYQPEGPTWYLRSQRTIETKMAGPMPGRQILKMLQNAGIKEDELKWTGLLAYLDTDERRSPQDVLEQMKSEGVDLREVVHGQMGPAQQEEYSRAHADRELAFGNYRAASWALVKELEKVGFEAGYAEDLVEKYMRNTASPEQRRQVEERGADLVTAAVERYQAIAPAQERFNQAAEARPTSAKFQQWVLPGGENYQELMLSLPAGRPEGDYTVPDAHQYGETATDVNRIVHARFNERLDSEGRRVLFVEEIQSDWHQAGREKGYRSEQKINPDALSPRLINDADEHHAAEWAIVDASGNEVLPHEFAPNAHQAMEQIRLRFGQGVPEGPWRKTWHELMFRRMLRWAAENDFDVLAWTTGEQQAERYDLSKQVDRVEYRTSDNFLQALKGGAAVFQQDGVAPEKLPDYIGKEAAKNLLEAKQWDLRDGGSLYVLEGEGLKVGGEGMKGFYDKILVDYAKKYGKQWGAKVGEAQISLGPAAITATGAGPWKAEGQELARVHSLALTPEMRESVLQGQTLFQPDPDLAEVQAAIAKGKPVPDNVLDAYREDPQVAAEVARRKLLMEQARRSSSLDEFTLWMSRAMSAAPATEAYYKMIYEAAQKATEDPAVAGERFLAVLDDQTIKDVFAEIQFVEGDNVDLMKALTPEMRELGKASGAAAAELVAKVRDQIAGNPTHWRAVLKDNLPLSLRAIQENIANKEVDADAPMDFRPVTARQANAAFIKLLQAENGLEQFLGDLYHEERMGARAKGKRGGQAIPPTLKIAASRALRGAIDTGTRKAALREIRADATRWREEYAGRYQDEQMLAQLQWEKDHADEAEDIRLRKDNSRLRDELKKLRVSDPQMVDLTTRKLDDLQKLVQEKDAALVEAAAKVAQSREALEQVEQKLSDREKEIVRAEMGEAPDEDAPPLIKAYRRRLERLEQQLAEQREAMRQALIARANSERAEKLTHYIFKPVDTGIADAEARMIEDIQSRLEYSPDDVDAALLSRLKEWRRQNPQAELPTNLVQDIEKRQPREMTLAELEEIAVQVRDLRRQGRAKRDEKLRIEREMIEEERDKLVDAVRGGGPAREISGLGTVGARQELRTPKLKQLYWGTLRMDRVAIILGAGKPGPFSEWLTTAIRDARDSQLDAVHKIMAAQEEKLKELAITPRMLGKQEQYPGRSYTHDEMLTVYIYEQFEKGLFSLQTDNRIDNNTINRIIGDLSKEEKAYGDWMVDTLSTDEHFDRMEAVHIDFNNQRMVREDRYFPFQRRELGSKSFMAEISEYLLEMRGIYKRKGVPGFLKARMDRYPGQVFPPLRLGASLIFNDYVQKSEWFIANAILVKRLNRFFNPQLGGKAVRSAILEKHGDAMLELVDKYIGAYENPNIYRAIDDWGGLARLMRSNVSLSMLGFNLMTMLRQLPDIPQIMVQAGPLDAIPAVARLLANPKETLEFFHSKAPQFRDRSIDRFTEELKLLDRNAYERTLAKVGNAGFLALKALDDVANVIGWTAIYNKTMRQTGNDIAATKAARDFLLSHRPAARAENLAQFYRQSGLVSWFLMFTNQQNQQFNIGFFDLPRLVKSGLSGNKKDMMQAVREATAMMVAAVGMAMVARKRMPEGEEWPKDILAWIFGNVPFVGNDIEGAIRGMGNWRGAIYPIGGAYDVAKAVTGLVEGQDMEKATKSAMNALWELSRTSGLPIVQAKRMVQFVSTGDPWEMLGGPPKAAGE